MRSFENKVAVITGAGSGMGRELALQLADLGSQVAIADINETGLTQTAEAILKKDGRVNQYLVDVSDRMAVHEFADRVVGDFGGVDIVINNAGVALSKVAVEHLTYEEMEWVLKVNLWGVVYGTKAFLPFLLQRPQANLVNISSTFGLTSAAKIAAYAASKFAVRGFTEALRQEMRGTPLAVTIVFPGAIKTGVARNMRKAQGCEEKDTPENTYRQFEARAPTTSAKAAKKIIAGIKHNAPRVLIGLDARWLDWIVRMWPDSYDWLMQRFVLGE